ncbi:MAG: hypothetical protein EAZ53_15680 [Bacteroidetes bacterium]|nr:MAG: hypothetical protein EAZ53_15680 [Bacteroidota bacterium]
MIATQKDEFFSIKSLELDTLLDITKAITLSKDEKSLLKIYIFTLAANFKIERLMMYENQSGKWNAMIKHGIAKDYSPHSEELMQVLDSNRFMDFEEEEFKSINQYFELSIPISLDNVQIASVLLGGTYKIKSHKESIKFIQTISNILFVAISNIRLTQKKIEQEALSVELNIARKLQFQLFPASLPNTEALKINATYIPHQTVGGDYYDYIPLPNNEFIVCIADVSGKGIAAAFIMSNLQAALRVLVKQVITLEQIIHELNAIVSHNTKGEKFVTLFLAKYIPRKNMMVYINCGHNPPFLMSENKEILTLEKGSLMLGAFENLPFLDTGKVYGINNSLLFAYTDGLTESFEDSNTEKAMEIIKKMMAENEQAELLNASILKMLSPQNNAMDDITLLSCKYQILDQIVA